nr:MAG TPA: Protein of unknown function (DUF4051) [Caudoviricetes sp.]
MKEEHTGIGVCNCRACRLDRRKKSTAYKKYIKRQLNKFRRRQLKQDEVLKQNRIGKYWA